MTLILSVITPGYVMQASDRRVASLTDAGEISHADDERNKAIFIAERMTFAYTGHAEIADQDTAEFFQGVMARSLGQGRSVQDALVMVGTMCAGYFRSLRSDVDRHHGFVGVGWEDERPHDAAPFIVCESNAIDVHGEWLSDPCEHFTTYRRVLGAEEPFALVAAGVALDESEMIRLNAQLGYLTTSSNDPEPVGRLLIEAIRGKAIDEEVVGSGVMLNCLPRQPGPPDGNIHFVSGPPRRDVRTFTYVPADTVLAYEYLGPLVAASDGHMFDDFRATGADVAGTTGFMYRPSSAPPIPRAAAGQRIREYRIGRNDPCWCGSGKKYKKCHAL